MTINGTISPMTIEYARMVSLWKYDGEYDFYDNG